MGGLSIREPILDVPGKVGGAKPPDFEVAGDPRHGPKWSQPHLPKVQPLNQILAFPNPLAASICFTNLRKIHMVCFFFNGSVSWGDAGGYSGLWFRRSGQWIARAPGRVLDPGVDDQGPC